jgi:hypothetical protein
MPPAGAAGIILRSGYEKPVSRRAETVVLLGAGALIVALVALNVMAAQGRFESGGDPQRAAAPATTDEAETGREPTSSETPPPATEPVETVAAETEAVTTTETATTPETEPPPPPKLVLTAARGECYLVVRRGSAEGDVLYEAILPQGGAVDFEGPRLWLRLGASANLDATLDGAPIELPEGTVDVLVTRAGARLA